jgi:nicotinamidase-related amidase
MQNGIVYHAHNFNTLVPNVRDLIAVARSTEIPIAFSQHYNFPVKWMEFGTKQLLRDGGVDLQKGWMLPGSTEWEIDPLLSPDGDELVVPIHTSSVFNDTPMEHLLHSQDIHTVILTGVSSQSGILVNARQALMLGFAVVVVEDAIGGSNEKDHEEALKLLEQGCELMTTAEVIDRFNRHAFIHVLPPALLGPKLVQPPPEPVEMFLSLEEDSD